MKIVGIVMIVLGSLMLLSSINLAFTKYNLNNSHELSQFLGGAAISALFLVLGISLFRKSSKQKPKE